MTDEEIMIPRDILKEYRKASVETDAALALLCLVVGGLIGWFAHMVWG